MRFGGSNLFSRSKRVIKEQETGRSAGRVFDFSFLDFSFPRPGTGNFDKAKRSEQRFEMIQEAEIIEESSDTIQEDETGHTEEILYTLTAEQRTANAEFERNYNWQQYSSYLFRGRVLDSSL